MSQSSSPFLFAAAVVPAYREMFGRETDIWSCLPVIDKVLRDSGNSLRPHLLKFWVKDGCIPLPCNAYRITSVSLAETLDAYGRPAKLGVPNTILYNYALPTFMASSQDAEPKEPENYALNKFYKPKGRFVDFQRVDNHLEVNAVEGTAIDVIYKSRILDEEGHPMLRESQLEAVCHLLNYQWIRKAFYKGEASAGHVELAKQEWKDALDAASCPEELTDNEYYSLLRSMHRIDRADYRSPSRG